MEKIPIFAIEFAIWKSELHLALNMIINGNKAKPHTVRTVGGKEIRHLGKRNERFDYDFEKCANN